MKSQIFKYLFVLLLPSVLISFAANSIILILLAFIAIVELKTDYSKEFLSNYLWFSTLILSFIIAFCLDILNHQEIKLSILTKRTSFVLLPIIFYYSRKDYQALALQVLVYFLSALSFILIIIGLIRSWINRGLISYGNWDSDTTEAFYSENMLLNWGELSYKRIFLFLDLHPTYYAFYSVVVILILVFTQLIKLRKWPFYALVILHAVMIILISSKAGIISLLLITAIAFFKNKSGKNLILGIGIISIIIVTALSIPSTQLRIKRAYQAIVLNDPSVSHSNAVGRLELWNSLNEFSPKELIIGSGYQTSRAKVKEITGQDKNMHNQFFQAIVSSGITGLILMMIFLLRPCFLMRHRFIYVFVSLLIFNLFLENMLDRIWGIMIISFFYSLFVFGDVSIFEKSLRTKK